MAARSGITEQCDKCKKQIGVYGFKKHRRIWVVGQFGFLQGKGGGAYDLA
jgi:hypothetical protein